METEKKQEPLTAQEVVDAAAPVARALGISAFADAPGSLALVCVCRGEKADWFAADDAARLLVGMVTEKCDQFGIGILGIYVGDGNRGCLEDYDGPRSLRTLFLATMRAFARATEVENG